MEIFCRRTDKKRSSSLVLCLSVEFLFKLHLIFSPDLFSLQRRNGIIMVSFIEEGEYVYLGQASLFHSLYYFTPSPLLLCIITSTFLMHIAENNSQLLVTRVVLKMHFYTCPDPISLLIIPYPFLFVFYLYLVLSVSSIFLLMYYSFIWVLPLPFQHEIINDV